MPLRHQILVVYFSQSGQVERAARATLAPLESVAELQYARLRPAVRYPLPWTYPQFLEAFPEWIASHPFGSAARKRRLRLFGVLLPLGAVLAAPFASAAAHVIRLLKPRNVDADVQKHLALTLRAPASKPEEYRK